jgi:hypothetical protein
MLFNPYWWPVLLLLGVLFWFYPIWVICGYCLLTCGMGFWMSFIENNIHPSQGEPTFWTNLTFTLFSPIIFAPMLLFGGPIL